MVATMVFASFFVFAHTTLASHPVLLIPGTIGTELYDPTLPGEDKLVWPNFGEMAISDTDAFMINSLTPEDPTQYFVAGKVKYVLKKPIVKWS